MRFHIVGLPHAQTTTEYMSCAFTQKVRLFSKMMYEAGHTVYLYAGEYNDAPCTEFVTCIDEKMREESLNGKHYTSASFNTELPHWQHFTKNVIAEISTRAQEKDFLCFIGGTAHRQIAQALPQYISVEFGIGYGATFAKYRVWESYSWMHSNYAGYKDPTQVDGQFFDTVIPGYFEQKDFPLCLDKEDYLLYVGRIIPRKGIDIAVQVAKELGKTLVMAGPGDPPKGVEYVGVVGAQKRAELMGKAQALLAPTLYIEPFGNIVPEAHFTGTPTITTDWGAFVETNLHGVTGYRCRTFDEFCKAVDSVWTLDPTVIHRRAVQNYSLEAIQPQYEKYFTKLLTLWNNGWYER